MPRRIRINFKNGRIAVVRRLAIELMALAIPAVTAASEQKKYDVGVSER
jgi:hypothetical protein